MLDLKHIRTNLENIKIMLKHRKSELDLSVFESLDKERRERLNSLESLRYKRNKVSEEIAVMKKNGEDASGIIQDMKKVSADIKTQEGGLSGINEELNNLLMLIPNIPHESVPVGQDEEDNALVRKWGEIHEMSFEPKAHWDIGEDLAILDFSRAAKQIGRASCRERV